MLCERTRGDAEKTWRSSHDRHHLAPLRHFSLCGTERENLADDAKGKGTSGSNREAESTDALVRGGLLRSSDEAGECPWSEGSGSSPWPRANRQREEPNVQWKAAAFGRWHEPDELRGSSPVL